MRMKSLPESPEVAEVAGSSRSEIRSVPVKSLSPDRMGMGDFSGDDTRSESALSNSPRENETARANKRQKIGLI